MDHLKHTASDGLGVRNMRMRGLLTKFSNMERYETQDGACPHPEGKYKLPDLFINTGRLLCLLHAQ